MKFNFWQWLGIVLVVIGGICWLVATSKHAPQTPAAVSPTTQSQP